MIGDAGIGALLEEARRAPSVHNVQPARWRFGPADQVLLLAEARRRLPLADPSGRDELASLGAAWEGMHLALARRGFSLGAPELLAGPTAFAREAALPPAGPHAADASLVPVARASFRPGAAPDPLGDAVFRRRAVRAAFAPLDAARLDALERRLAPAGDVKVVRDRAAIGAIGKLADRAQVGFLGVPGMWAETWDWLRLSPRHPDWDRDGLNAEALALSGFERAAGTVLMRPATFELMRRLGLAGALVSELSKVRSASALLLFTAPRGVSAFVTGRRFYRLWLELTAEGIALCPMSVLADSAEASEEIRRRHGIATDHGLVNVLRIGKAPEGDRALTPRLPAAELEAREPAGGTTPRG